MQDCYEHTNARGVTYYLHYADVKLRGGEVKRIYYFKRDMNPETKGTPCQLPDDREVRENPRNGFLAVVRKRR